MINLAPTTASAINAAINSLSAGGKVCLGAGEFLIDTPIVMKSKITLEGEGFGATTLKLAPGANCDVLKTDGFDTLVNTGSLGGCHSFHVRDLKIDGNKANNSSGRGLCLYGWRYSLEHVIVGDCKGDGIHSEWGDWGAPAPHRSMEATWLDVQTHDCDGRGVYFNGPHDSRILAMLSACDTGGNFHIGPRAGGTKFALGHGWSYGPPQQNPARQSAVCWKIDSAVSLTGCHGEGATDTQLWIRANDVEVSGGWFFRMSQDPNNPAHDNTCKAIRIGETDGAWAGGYQIRTKVFNTLAGGIEFTNRAAFGEIDVLSYMWGAPSNLIVGPPPITAGLRLYNQGQSPAYIKAEPGV